MPTGNMHTAEFYILTSEKDVDYILQHQGKHPIARGISCSVNKNSLFIFVKLDAIQLLQKSEISEADSDNLFTDFNYALDTILGRLYDPVMKRIDLRIDVDMPENERALFFKLAEKTTSKSGSLYKAQEEKYKHNSLRYQPKSKYGSISINIYDKEHERRDKDEVVKSSEKVLRMEIALKNRHLNYCQSRMRNSKVKQLEEYLNTEVLYEYLNKYIKPILYPGDYYLLRSAQKIVNERLSNNLERKAVNSLLSHISSHDIDSAKRKFGVKRFRKYVGILEALAVNPLTIPKGHPIKHLQNPLNSVYKPGNTISA